jgi:hypothetical protein
MQLGRDEYVVKVKSDSDLMCHMVDAKVVCTFMIFSSSPLVTPEKIKVKEIRKLENNEIK